MRWTTAWDHTRPPRRGRHDPSVKRRMITRIDDYSPINQRYIIPEAIEAGAVEPRAGVAGVGADVLGTEVVSLLSDPFVKGGELTVNRVVTVLLLGRDAGVERCPHGRASLVSLTRTPWNPGRA